MLGQDEPASPADLQKATEKVQSVHAFLKSKGILRWTYSNIPDFAEEPYVLMAAFLGAPDFQVERDPSGWEIGLALFYTGVNMPKAGRTQAEYF